MASYAKKEQDYREYLKAGMGPTLIAQMTGDGVAGVAAYLRKLPDWQVIQQPGVNRCRQMRLEGYEYKTIARYTGWSERSVRNFCVGLPVPDRPKKLIKRKEDVVIIPARPENTAVNRLLTSPWGTGQWTHHST